MGPRRHHHQGVHPCVGASAGNNFIDSMTRIDTSLFSRERASGSDAYYLPPTDEERKPNYGLKICAHYAFLFLFFPRDSFLLRFCAFCSLSFNKIVTHQSFDFNLIIAIFMNCFGDML